MKIKLKDIIKLVLSIGLTAFVLVKASKDFDWSEVGIALREFQYGWIFLSMGLSLLSHWLRAYRWTLLLGTQYNRPSTLTAFFAVMVTYLANMAIPRLGEVARCTVMNDEEKIPVSFSLGTVITDRLLDLFMLGVLTLFLLIMQLGKLQSFFTSFISEKLPMLETLWPYLLGAFIGGFIFLIWVVRKSRNSESKTSQIYKIGQFTIDLVTGIRAIGKITNQVAFWISTLGIWVLYFLMLYVISFGFAPTADMSLMAGVAVLVMGSTGMATPVSNGIGAYQAFVASILVLYGIEYADGFTFAVISHGSQMVSVIIFGFLSLLILNFRKREKVVGT